MRFLAHVHLHRALCDKPRFGLELRAAVGRAKDAGRPPAAHGLRCAVVGKTHVEADVAGAERLGLDISQGRGLVAMEGGFEPYERDDGILPPGFKAEGNRYCDYLRA